MIYRKKPVEIEAFQMTQERCNNKVDWPNWLHVAWQENRFVVGFFSGTSVGTLQVSRDDWIIKGVKGELYLCKPDIFEATYEKVDAFQELVSQAQDLDMGY
jgi:hypothetical protein